MKKKIFEPLSDAMECYDNGKVACDNGLEIDAQTDFMRSIAASLIYLCTIERGKWTESHGS